MALSGSIAVHGGLPPLRPDQPLGDALFGTIEPGQKQARAIPDRVGDHRPLGPLQRDRRIHHLGCDLQQRRGQLTQLVHRQAAMAVVHGLGQSIADPGAGPDHGRLLDAEPHRDLVRTLEADAPDVAGKAIGVLRDDLHGIGAVGLEDPHGARGADTMAMQKQHDLADHLLFGPAVSNPQGALGSDAGDLLKTFRRLRDDVEHVHPKGLHQLAGVDRADALDHAGAEIALDAFQRGGRGGLEEGRLELQPMGTVVQPNARGLDELAGADGCRGTDHRDQIALTTHLDPQHAKAVVGVVEGHPLDQAGERLALNERGRVHQGRMRSSGCDTSSFADAPNLPLPGSKDASAHRSQQARGPSPCTNHDGVRLAAAR